MLLRLGASASLRFGVPSALDTSEPSGAPDVDRLGRLCINEIAKRTPPGVLGWTSTFQMSSCCASSCIRS
jgi:hypothetical protein